MPPDLPDSARLALWLDAWVRGATASDDLLDALGADDTVHTVADATTSPAGDTVPLALALGRLRRGTTGVGIALPVAGDPAGLAGPRTFADAALEAEQAVVLLGSGIGLVPDRSGDVVTWTAYDAHLPRPVPMLRDAARALRVALVEAAQALADLQVARWRPEIADELTDLRRPRADLAVPGTAPEVAPVIAQALLSRRVIDLALDDEGGAVDLGTIERRRALLGDLDHAARHALVAACSADAQR